MIYGANPMTFAPNARQLCHVGIWNVDRSSHHNRVTWLENFCPIRLGPLVFKYAPVK